MSASRQEKQPGKEKENLLGKNLPLFDRSVIAAEDLLVCILLQFLITGFNCWQVGKSSVTGSV